MCWMLDLLSAEYRKGLISRVNGLKHIKLIKTLCIMLVLALMSHMLNKIFQIKYETHAYGI